MFCQMLLRICTLATCFVCFTDGTNEQIQFIDTAPWLEFPVMHRLYVRTCQLVIIAYNVTKKDWKESLTSLIKQVRDIKGKQML